MIAERMDAIRNVDWWPLARIVITASVLALVAHIFLGWNVQPRHLLSMPGQIFGVLSLMAMISFALADLYLLLFLIPLWIVGVLNDWFYGVSRCACRAIFRFTSGAVLAFGGLCGEIFLFGGLGYLLHRLFTL